MFENVKSMLTMWIDCKPVVTSLGSEYRVNRYNTAMIHHQIELSSLDHRQDIFNHVERELNGKCVTIQLFFHGTLPKEQLTQLGFQPTPADSRIFKLQNSQEQVSALSLDATQSWVLQFTKRKGHGLTGQCLDFQRLFESTQLTLPLDLEAM